MDFDLFQSFVCAHADLVQELIHSRQVKQRGLVACNYSTDKSIESLQRTLIESLSGPASPVHEAIRSRLLQFIGSVSFTESIVKDFVLGDVPEGHFYFLVSSTIVDVIRGPLAIDFSSCSASPIDVFELILKFDVSLSNLVVEGKVFLQESRLNSTVSLYLKEQFEAACEESNRKKNSAESIPELSLEAVVDSPHRRDAAAEGGMRKRGAVYDAVSADKCRQTVLDTKEAHTKIMLMNALKKNILFSSFSSAEHDKIVEVFECITVEAATVVIHQGDSAEHFFVIESGSLELFINNSEGESITTGQHLTGGQSFGELALLYGIPRTATIVASTESVLWRVDRHTYRYVVARGKQMSIMENIAFIQDVEVLGQRLGSILDEKELGTLVTGLEQEKFEDGQVIVRQDQPGDCFYIIKSGTVAVHRVLADSHPSSSEASDELGDRVAVLTTGQYFGEKALLEEDVRQASCVALGSVLCLSLSRDMFIRLVGSWQDVTALRSRNISAESVELAADSDAHSHIVKLDQGTHDEERHSQFEALTVDRLELMNTIGTGAFGVVKLARVIGSDELYVLKMQGKKAILEHNMGSAITNEIILMKDLRSSFVAKLYSSFQDSRAVYMLLEYIDGGDFFSFLQRSNNIEEEVARFYTANVVAGLEAMHALDIAYRDLKPENLVMDHRGYVKIVDLGLAKKISSGQTWTMCGTPDYIAPEIITNKGHDKTVDYWSLGVLVYEMVDGWPPFYHENPMKVYQKITSGRYDKSKLEFSPPLSDFVDQLLQKNPAKRLGGAKGGIGDVLKHKWLGSVDWKGLHRGTLSAPIVPEKKTSRAAESAVDPSMDPSLWEPCDWEVPLDGTVDEC